MIFILWYAEVKGSLWPSTGAIVRLFSRAPQVQHKEALEPGSCARTYCLFHHLCTSVRKLSCAIRNVHLLIIAKGSGEQEAWLP